MCFQQGQIPRSQQTPWAEMKYSLAIVSSANGKNFWTTSWHLAGSSLVPQNSSPFNTLIISSSCWRACDLGHQPQYLHSSNGTRNLGTNRFAITGQLSFICSAQASNPSGPIGQRTTVNRSTCLTKLSSEVITFTNLSPKSVHSSQVCLPLTAAKTRQKANRIEPCIFCLLSLLDLCLCPGVRRVPH